MAVKAKHIIVVGAGPAGMMAAGQAALGGAHVLLLEKMARPGRKLSITGKGRCNITNVADAAEFVARFGASGSFLVPAFNGFGPPELMAFLDGLGVGVITERGGRVFPESGSASQVTRALVDWLARCGVSLRTSNAVAAIEVRQGRVAGVTVDGERHEADAVVVATGGASYPATGSNGDGYRLAAAVGHRVTPVRPALVPLETRGDMTARLADLNLRNVGVLLCVDGKARRQAFGEVVFAEFGVSGPAILTLSGDAVDAMRDGCSVTLVIDLKPGLEPEKVVARLTRDFEARGQERIADVLRALLPAPMVAVCCRQVAVDDRRPAAGVSPRETQMIAAWLKGVRLEVRGHRPFSEAIVTAGGVAVGEVDPLRMESNKVRGLFFAGEVLDVHADTGGYNLQAAFSTGWVAGRAAVGALPEPIAPQEAPHSRPRATSPPRAGSHPMFLPTTRADLDERGWDALDVILVTGDCYIDSPFVGVAVVGRVLEAAGYRVGIVGQPDVASDDDIARLGEPRLFWGVTGGCIDSMVANRTASGRKRKRDDYTPGGVNDRRPDRAAIIYSNLIRRCFKSTRPIVLGGIEASLRRVAHYDFWTDKIRKSILFDAKADYLLYGMADRSVAELAGVLAAGESPAAIRGLCTISTEKPDDCIELPTFRECAEDKDAFTEMFHTLYRNNDPVTASPLAQKQDTRYLVQNPPALYLSTRELDAVHELPYTRDVHPFYGRQGEVRGLQTIRSSIAAHRGCYGECNFCAIAVHQGRTVRWRSQRSVLAEARTIAAQPGFGGILMDVGGPTANMYGFECAKKGKDGCCPDKRCLYPRVCGNLGVDHSRQLALLRKLREVKGVRKVVVASGIRHDLILADREHGQEYLQELLEHHTSGQLKIAPEHSEDAVLAKMGKPGRRALVDFKALFDRLVRRAGGNRFLTYYMIAAHPGCTDEDMRKLREFASRELKVLPRQIQIFTPTPSTYSTLMYWTERDPFTGEPCFVEKTVKGRERQKNILLGSR